MTAITSTCAAIVPACQLQFLANPSPVNLSFAAETSISSGHLPSGRWNPVPSGLLRMPQRLPWHLSHLAGFRHRPKMTRRSHARQNWLAQGLTTGVSAVETGDRATTDATKGDSSLFSRHGFVRTLEISTSAEGPWALLPGGEKAGAALLEDGVFHVTVHPDLPPVTTLWELLQYPWKQAHTKQGANQTSTAQNLGGPMEVSRKPLGGGSIGSAWQVRTVAAQVRSLPAVRTRMAERAEEIGKGDGGGSLLLVSGGHPLRGVPILNHLMPTNSEEMLRAAHGMRREGQLPAGVQLWAVTNPMADSAQRLERKIEAGAEAIITQPPLLPDRFQQWWGEVTARGLPATVPIIIGVPIISSAANLAFWLRLTNASGPEAEAVLRSFQEGEGRAGPDKAELALYRREYTLAMMRAVRQLSGAKGMHVMPVSRRGWRDLLALQGELLVDS